MQKVEGSNPFSRSQKRPAFAGLFRVHSRLVRLLRRAPNGHPAASTAQERLRTSRFAGRFLTTRTIDLLFVASASDAVAGACTCSQATPGPRPERKLPRPPPRALATTRKPEASPPSAGRSPAARLGFDKAARWNSIDACPCWHAAGRAPRPTTDHPDGFRAQCPANAATTGASVSAEPAPKTK